MTDTTNRDPETPDTDDLIVHPKSVTEWLDLVGEHVLPGTPAAQLHAFARDVLALRRKRIGPHLVAGIDAAANRHLGGEQ